ncbi:hypothetical protein M0805_008003 [Coniferiporia weirii]|nr:hypothetical protein M0805_008003 [Coniferiporia weirii]
MRGTQCMGAGSFFVVTSKEATSFGAYRMASSAQDNLQRGKACLSCRYAPIRCDGLRPICAQCSRRNRGDDCEYTDKNGPTRTEILEGSLARLQARIKELEQPDDDIEDEHPQAPTCVTIDTSLPPLPPPSRGECGRILRVIPCAGAGLETLEITSPSSEGSTDASHFSDDMGHGPGSSSPASSIEPPPWWELDEPPPDIANMLIRHFLPNSQQLGFALSIRRFLEALEGPMLPHNALMNAIYMWALRLSRNPDLQRHEDAYLQKALMALQDIPSSSPSDPADITLATKIVQVIQAEVLVSQYLYCYGRMHEGRYHIVAAISLALSYGFNRLSPTSVQDAKTTLRARVDLNLLTQSLAPPRDLIEYGERVNVFWSVYNVDRCWSVTGAPCILTDDAVHGTQIDTPWPLDAHEYGMAAANPEIVTLFPSNRTIQRFIAGEPPLPCVSDTSYAAMRVKASALYGRARKLTLAWGSDPTHDARELLRADMNNAVRLALEFTAALPELENLEMRIESSDARRTIYVVHVLMHTAIIVLYQVWASEGDGNAVRMCLAAADEVSRVSDMGGPTVLRLLDPVLGTVGAVLARFYAQELARARNAPDSPEAREHLALVEKHTQRLIQAAKEGNQCPVYGLQTHNIFDIIQTQMLIPDD